MHAVHKTFLLDIAHFLPKVPEGHPCKRLHGHRMEITLGIRGQLDPKLDWVVDTQWIAQAFEPFYQQLDHKLLNEIPGLENPTSELLAIWLWNAIKSTFPGLYMIKVAETASSGVIYYGPTASNKPM